MGKIILLAGLLLVISGQPLLNAGPDMSQGNFVTNAKITEAKEPVKEKASKNPLAYTVDMMISIDWQVDKKNYEDIKKWLIVSNNILFDITDGQFRFNKVEIYDNKNNWDKADVRISNAPGARPDMVGMTQMIDGKFTYVGTCIRLSEKLPTNAPLPPGLNHIPIFSDNGAHAFIHEVCHYIFGLNDEYGTGRRCQCIMQGGQVAIGKDGKPQGIGATEMCSKKAHDNPCWDVVKRRYPKITEPTGDPDEGPAEAVGPIIVINDTVYYSPLPPCDLRKVEQIAFCKVCNKFFPDYKGSGNKCPICRNPLELKEACIKSTYTCPAHPDVVTYAPGKCTRKFPLSDGNKTPKTCGQTLQLKDTVPSEIVSIYECPKCHKRSGEKGKCEECKKDLVKKKSCKHSGLPPHTKE